MPYSAACWRGAAGSTFAAHAVVNKANRAGTDNCDCVAGLNLFFGMASSFPSHFLTSLGPNIPSGHGQGLTAFHKLINIQPSAAQGRRRYVSQGQAFAARQRQHLR
jgi:hypothetical protein